MANNSTRYYPLIDEIKYHVFNWATDSEWKKLPNTLNVALTQVMNELKIHYALQAVGKLDDRNEPTEKQSKVAFVNIFKRKYLELTDLNFSDPITPVNQVNINRVISEVDKAGGSYTEFIEWFFDDFCSLEINKKYLPPQINFMCSSFVVNKYLFFMKDTLKMRKKQMDNMAVRTMLLEIALPMAERTKSKEFSQKILDFSHSIITSTKFFDLMKKFAVKLDDKIAIEACNKIDSNREEAKNKK